MTKKKKIRMIVIMPTLIVVLLIGALLTFVLTMGAGRAQEDASSGYSGAVEGSMPVGSAVAMPDGSEQAPPNVTPVACDFGGWVGKPVDEAAVKATGRPYRILKPNTPATEDYSAARINVQVDDGGIVTAISCW